MTILWGAKSLLLERYGRWIEEDWGEGGWGWRSLCQAHLRSLFKPLAFAQRAGSLHSVDYAICLVCNTKRIGTYPNTKRIGTYP